MSQLEALQKPPHNPAFPMARGLEKVSKSAFNVVANTFLNNNNNEKPNFAKKLNTI